MTAIELHNIFLQNNWTAERPLDSNNYEVPEKIRYALVASLTDLNDITRQDVPRSMVDLAMRKAKADYRSMHRYDPAKRNKSINQLLKDYYTKGKKIKARVELKARIPYVSYAEQKIVLCIFLLSSSIDRKFALRYLETHWDDYYAPFVENAWRDYHEMDAARCITHHFPLAFIEANQEALSADYLYLQVRLRLPASAPIDRSKLSSSAFLYLCARQSLPISDKEAERLFYQVLLDLIARYDLNNRNLCDVQDISSMIWSLGMLGKTDILLRFVEFQRLITPYVIDEQWEDVRNTFSHLKLSLNFSHFEECLRNREQQKQLLILPDVEPF